LEVLPAGVRRQWAKQFDAVFVAGGQEPSTLT
jgi:hypothetical protein